MIHRDNLLRIILQVVLHLSLTKISMQIIYLKFHSNLWGIHKLTHWGRVTHFCVSILTSIASDNALSPGRRQAIIWINAGILLIGSLGTNFNEILIELQTFSLKKIRLKMSSAKCRPFCLGLNVLTLQAIAKRDWMDTFKIYSIGCYTVITESIILYPSKYSACTQIHQD